MADARPNFFDFDVTKMFADFRYRPFDVEAVCAVGQHAEPAATGIRLSQRAIASTRKSW